LLWKTRPDNRKRFIATRDGRLSNSNMTGVLENRSF